MFIIGKSIHENEIYIFLWDNIFGITLDSKKEESIKRKKIHVLK